MSGIPTSLPEADPARPPHVYRASPPPVTPLTQQPVPLLRRLTFFHPIEGKADPLLVVLDWPAVLESFRRAEAARGEGTAGGRTVAAAAATATASAAAISRTAVGGTPAGYPGAGGSAPKPTMGASALGPAGGGSGSSLPFMKPSPGLVSMDALVAVVKAALPESGGPPGSAELRMALQRRHAALFVLQECGLEGTGDATAAATVHVNQFRKCRVSLTRLGERQSWA